MRKGIACLLVLAMLFTSLTALAEVPYSMAGCDGEGANHDWTTNLFFKRMEEKTGLTFIYEQFTEQSVWQAAKAAYLSGQTAMPDMLFKAGLTTHETMDLMAAGKIIDLKPYLAEHAPNLTALLAAHPEWEKAITLPTGEIPALPYINELQNNNAMWINRQWLDNLGLSVPTTAEEFTQTLRAFKYGDPNRNGKRDEVPLTFLTMWDLKFLGHAFGLIADDYNVYVDEQGQVQTTLTTDENRAFLTWLNQLWQEGLLDRSGFTSADSLRAITDSDASITYGVMLAPTPLSLVPNTAIGQYELLMPLTYQGKQVYRDLNGDLVRGAFAISSTCQDPAKLVAWVDYLYSEEGCQLAQAGQEGVDFEWHEDGTWSWVADAQTVATSVLTDATIAEGGLLPGLASVSFQAAYDEKETARAIKALMGLKEVSVEPYPLVWRTAAQQEQLNKLQMEVGKYAEQTMTWFVTGNMPLTDETWSTFTSTLEEKGLNELIALMQQNIK